MTVNIFVHSVMYTYYALRAAGVRIPKKIAVSITSIQVEINLNVYKHFYYDIILIALLVMSAISCD